jgi:acyl carrier protein
MPDPTNGHTHALVSRLAGLPEDARPAALLELVRAETAELMGATPDAIDPDAPYRAYGYTSLAAVELASRLSTATGLDLPLTLLFDHPTPSAVTGHLLELLGLGAPALAPGAAPPQPLGPAPASAAPAHGPLTTLLLAAHARGELGATVPRLQAAGGGHPSFAAADRLDAPPKAVLVSEGAPAPAVVCVPSFLAGSGPHQFTRFAARFAPRLRMSGLTLPGFDGATPLPATWRAAVDSLTTAALRAAGDAPLLLVGGGRHRGARGPRRRRSGAHRHLRTRTRPAARGVRLGDGPRPRP